MDQLLVQQLLALGQDTQLRKQNLLILIPNLTQHEIRDLTALLSKIDFRTDILSRLPPELRANIAGQFGEIDVFPLLNVSRQWRAFWLQPDILSIISQQCRYLDPGLFAQLSLDLSPGEWIARQYELIRRRHYRFLGKFSSAIVVRHDVREKHSWLKSGLDLAGVFPPWPGGEHNPPDLFNCTGGRRFEHQLPTTSSYEAGRLAWIPDNLPAPGNALLVVEDLYNRTKRIYRNPSAVQFGDDFQIRAMGDKLLVAGTSRVMFIWHLESNECSQLTLPRQPGCCVTRGEHVAFLQFDIALVWKWGSQLKTLDITPVLASNKQIAETWPGTSSYKTMGIFFHPFVEGTLYITVCFDYIRQVMIHRFEAATYSGAQQISIRDFDECSRFDFDENPPRYSITPCWASRPVNSYGEFAVAEWRAITPGKTFSRGPASGQVHISGITLLETRFNVQTNRCSLVEKSMPSGSWDLMSQTVGPHQALPSWNDQMVFSLRASQEQRLYGGAGVSLTGFLDLDLALVAVPFHRPHTAHGDARVYSLGLPRFQQASSAMYCAFPRNIPVEEHLRAKRLELIPAKSLTLRTEDGRLYDLKPQSHSPHTNTELLRSLYAESYFNLDLTPILSFHQKPGTVHIFQDDDFIILFHRYGYMAWDFRPAART